MTENVILQGIVGSTAYGLAREGSDLDRLGIFVTPANEIAGWGWDNKKETVHKAGPGVDDITLHEVRKFLYLACKSNPTITELLWLPEYEQQNIYGNIIVEAREAFLSRHHVHNAYMGYARQQLSKFGGEYKAKHARHTLRLVRQGRELLETGQLTVKVPDPETYFAFDDMPVGAVLEMLTSEILALDEVEKSPLRDEPDLDSAQDILAAIRTAHP